MTITRRLRLNARKATSDIKVAFRKQAMQCHPDRNPGDKDAEHRFKELNEAYDVLAKTPTSARPTTVSASRLRAGGMGGAAHGFGADFGTTFSTICSKEFSACRPAAAAAPAASAARICATTWRSALRGGVRRQGRADPHPDLGHLRGVHRQRRRGLEPNRRPARCAPATARCALAGLLHPRTHLSELPGPRPGHRQSVRRLRRRGPRHARAHAVGQYSAGVEDGTRIRLAGEGEAGVRGGPTGDLYIFLSSARIRSSSARAPTCTAACRSRW